MKHYFWGYIGAVDSDTKAYSNETYQYTDEVCVFEDKIWFVTYYNLLLATDIHTGKTTLKASLKDKEVWAYHFVLHLKNYIIIMPLNGKNIAVYNMKDDNVRYLDLGEKTNVFTAFIYHENVYFISNKICCFKPDENACVVLKDFVSEPFCAGYQIWTAACLRDKLHFVPTRTNLLGEYDLKKGKLIWYKLWEKGGLWTSIAAWNGGLFLYGLHRDKAIYFRPEEKDGWIFIREHSNGKWQSKRIPVEEFWCQEGRYQELWNQTFHYKEVLPQIYEDKVMLYHSGHEVWLFDIESGEVENRKISCESPQNGLFRTFFPYHNLLYYMPTFSDHTLYCSDGSHVAIELEKSIEERELDFSMQNHSIVENNYWSIKKFVDSI